MKWAGHVGYGSPQDLPEALGQLAAELSQPVRRACVVLERAVVQLRAIVPAPPLKRAAAAQYVALEASRLFRKNGAPLVTDARIVAIDENRKGLWCAAVPEPLLRAILEGCSQAGIVVEALGPAADVIDAAVETGTVRPGGEITLPHGPCVEVLSFGLNGTWRSRLVAAFPPASPARDPCVTWKPALARLEPDAVGYASAFASCQRLPQLDLLPVHTRAAKRREAKRRQLRLLAVGLSFWLAAAGVSSGRMLAALDSSTRFLQAVAQSLDSAVAQRRDLDAGRATLQTMSTAAARRSRQLALLADLTGALDDSVFLVTLRIGPGQELRLAGYAPRAARVLAKLDRVARLHGAKLEGPVTRENPGDHGALDRFGVVAHLSGPP